MLLPDAGTQPEPLQAKTAPQRLKVFVSYSRANLDFADQLVAALEAFGFPVTIDRVGIHGGERWEERLGQLILGADAVVFVLTPRSAVSEICKWEVDQALALNKRILPILAEPLGTEKPHTALQGLNYIHFYAEPTVPGSGFGVGLGRLIAALTVNVEWLREHTRVSELAAAWQAQGRLEDLLARGAELARLRRWRDERPAEAPELTVAQRAYLQTCEDAEAARTNAEAQRLADMTAAQDEREKALQAAEAAQAERAQALEAARAEQVARAHAQKRNRWLTGAAAALAIALFGGALWQTRQTDRREAIVLTSAADRAINDQQYERAMRIAVHGLPRPSRIPLLSLSWDDPAIRGLEAKLSGAASLSALRRVLLGHGELVTSAAFSADGARIVTASWDNTARVWDAVSGEELRKLEGHGESVTTAAFSADGARIVTASGDKTARVWDTASGQELRKLEGHGDNVASAAFSADGARIITASRDKTARVWDTASGQELRRLEGHDSPLQSAAFSADGARVVTARKLEGHDSFVLSAAFSADGARVVTASGDKTARVWDTASGQELRKLEGRETVTSATFSADGARIVTTSADKTARVWDAATGRELRKLEGHGVSLTRAAFSADGARIVTASGDKTARVWDATTSEKLRTLEGHGESVNSAALSADGARIVTASEDKTARVWEAATGQELRKLEGHGESVSSAAFSADGARIVTASLDNTARVWDAASGQELRKLEGHGENVNTAAFSADGARIVTASFDKTARVWDAALLIRPRADALVSLVCVEKLVQGAQEFTTLDAGDPILAGLSGTNPCTQTGPLSIAWWRRLFR